ncbi:MAG TPA: hypothetical protein VFU65_08665 [Actinocrinis sp.]|nr:hypothetical protein [Actinocrinis sp.]
MVNERIPPDADGHEQDEYGMFDGTPHRLLRALPISRLAVAAAALGVVAGGGVAVVALRPSGNYGSAPPPAVVPVIGPRNASAVNTAGAGAPSPSPSATSASPQPSPSPKLTRASASPSPTRLAPTGYEGDSSANILADGTYIGSCSGCPDGTKVRHVGGGSTLTFPDVKASVAGSYMLTIAYADGDATGGRDAIVTVDGAAVDVFFTSNGDWNSAQTLTLTVHLNRGLNSIEFGNPKAMGPDIAEIVI